MAEFGVFLMGLGAILFALAVTIAVIDLWRKP